MHSRSMLSQSNVKPDGGEDPEGQANQHDILETLTILLALSKIKKHLNMCLSFKQRFTL